MSKPVRRSEPFPKGTLVTIVSTQEAARPYLHSDAIIVGELSKSRNEPVPTYKVRDIDSGMLLYAMPFAIAGPLPKGPSYSRGSWADCPWQPKALRKT